MRNVVFDKTGAIISDSGWLKDEQIENLISGTKTSLSNMLSKSDHQALKKAEGQQYSEEVLTQRANYRAIQNALEVNLVDPRATEDDMDAIDLNDISTWEAFNSKFG